MAIFMELFFSIELHNCNVLKKQNKWFFIRSKIWQSISYPLWTASEASKIVGNVNGRFQIII